MTPDELRALADALEPMARAPRFEDFDVPAFCAWVRAQADAQPVAWRDHVEQRIRGWRQRTMNRSGDRLALDDMMGQDTIDDLIDYVCDEWSDPAPAAPQAEPKREPSLGELMREQRQSRIVAGVYPDGNPNAGAMMAQTRQAEPKRPAFLDEIDRAKEHVASWPQWMKDATVSAAATLPVTEPKREPLSDEQIDVALQTDPAMILELMGGEMTVGEFKLALRRLARTVERAHGIGGSNEHQ